MASQRLTRVHRAHRILPRIIPRRQSNHDIERHDDPTLRPVRLGVRRDIVHEEARPNKKNDLEQIEVKSFFLPKSRDIGLFNHQPSNATNGIQNSRNWMLKSIARASARIFGSDGALKKWRRQDRMKNQIASTASAENDTTGRRTIPNHSSWLLSLACKVSTLLTRNSAVKAIRVTVTINRMIHTQGLTSGSAISSSRSFSSAPSGIS